MSLVGRIILTCCKLSTFLSSARVIIALRKPGQWLSYPLRVVEVNEAHEINQVLS
jgi:hypothetical protein